MNDWKKNDERFEVHNPGFRRLTGSAILIMLLSLVCSGNAIAQAKDGNVDITPGFKIIEGDIQVPESGTRMPFASNLYPNGVIPYEFDANVNQANQNGLGTISFQQCGGNNCTGQPNYVHIQDSTGNNSPVGAGGKRIINIVSWNSTFSMAHELSHTCGVWHEQSRADRDTYVTINTSNIQSSYVSDFAIHSEAGIYGYYDFDSDKCSFSTNCPAGSTCNCAAGTETITVKPPYDSQWQNAIGQRDHMSYLDKTTLSFLYARSDWRFVDQNFVGSQLGTFLNPFTIFVTGEQSTPINGTLWVQPGSYSAVGTHNKTMTIQAPLGGVTLGN